MPPNKSYIYIQVVYFNSENPVNNTENIVTPLNSTWFKFTVQEYNQFRIKMGTMMTKSDNENKNSMKRIEINFRELQNLLDCTAIQIVNIYEYRIDRNILKDDIPEEINKYHIENKSYIKSEFISKLLTG